MTAKIQMIKYFWFISIVIMGCTNTNYALKSESPSWDGIVIGKSTRDDVVATFGTPPMTTIVNNDTAYDGEYEVLRYDQGGSYADGFFVDLQCHCVVYMEENLIKNSNGEDYIFLPTMLAQYGKPELIIGSFLEETFVYASQGIAIEAVASIPAAESVALIKYYFEPMSLENYLETWGADHEIRAERDVDPEWSPYVYENVIEP